MLQGLAPGATTILRLLQPPVAAAEQRQGTQRIPLRGGGLASSSGSSSSEDAAQPLARGAEAVRGTAPEPPRPLLMTPGHALGRRAGVQQPDASSLAAVLAEPLVPGELLFSEWAVRQGGAAPDDRQPCGGLFGHCSDQRVAALAEQTSGQQAATAAGGGREDGGLAVEEEEVRVTLRVVVHQRRGLAWLGDVWRRAAGWQ